MQFPTLSFLRDVLPRLTHSHIHSLNHQLTFISSGQVRSGQVMLVHVGSGSPGEMILSIPCFRWPWIQCNIIYLNSVFALVYTSKLNMLLNWFCNSVVVYLLISVFFLYLSICFYFCLSLSMSVCLSLCQSVFSVYLIVCLSLFLSFSLSLSLYFNNKIWIPQWLLNDFQLTLESEHDLTWSNLT